MPTKFGFSLFRTALSDPFLKSQQLVPVVFVLLLSGGDLGGQAVGQVVAEGVEVVEDGDDAALLLD